MIVKMFSVYDSKVKSYAQPFFAPTKGAAIRMFSDLVADSSTMVAKHPGDFTLFEIGSYDDQTAGVVALITPESCGLALDYVQSS